MGQQAVVLVDIESDESTDVSATRQARIRREKLSITACT
jgi:hypothetical protein